MEIDNIDLDKCKPFKDFGSGFYTTPLFDQALSMAKRTVRIYRTGKPCITEYSFNDNVLSNLERDKEGAFLNILRFNEPSSEWARFVINNRNRRYINVKNPECNIDCKYDIVIGPVANDDITALVDVYLLGILSDEALAKELTFRDLSMQVSFHTNKAISYLHKTRTHYE
jgi:hypothetical protein